MGAELRFWNVNTSDWTAWTITPAGKIWQDRLGIHDWDGNPNNAWTTELDATAGADGTIKFNGYYGEYELTTGGNVYKFELKKGITDYSLGALNGDFNLDGVVDAADYTLWKDRAGSAAEYLLWKANFGCTLQQPASIALPEPALSACMISLLLALQSARYRLHAPTPQR